MRSVTLTVGPHSTAGTYYYDASGMCLNTLILAISGTASAKVQQETVAGIWTDMFNNQTATYTNTSTFTLGPCRLVINSVDPGSSVGVYHAGLRGG